MVKVKNINKRIKRGGEAIMIKSIHDTKLKIKVLEYTNKYSIALINKKTEGISLVDDDNIARYLNISLKEYQSYLINKGGIKQKENIVFYNKEQVNRAKEIIEWLLITKKDRKQRSRKTIKIDVSKAIKELKEEGLI
jgi:hypothetical protein